MARIAGVNVPQEKNIEVSLTYVYGVGRKVANKILAAVEVHPYTKTKDLDEATLDKIRDYITKNLMVEGDLRRKVAQDIKRLKEINCYRGFRHRRNLPVRGQSSKNNARTRKGRKKTIANKKK